MVSEGDQVRSKDAWTPWTVGWPSARPFPTIRCLITEAENRLRSTLATHSVVPARGVEPLVHALIRSNSVAATLAEFGFLSTAMAPLVEALELVMGIADQTGDADE
jgi:hypothetical protein